MPAPSLTEIGKLTSLGLIKHYQQHQAWYIQQGKVLVATMKSLVGNTKTISGSPYAFTQDEVGNMLYTWFMHNHQWQQLLHRKPHLPPTQYDLITDAMARHIAYDAYIAIIT